MRKHVLFYPPNDTAVETFIEFACYMKANSYYQPYFLLERRLIRHVFRLREMDIEFTVLGRGETKDIKANEFIQSPKRKASRFLHWLKQTDCFAFAEFIVHYKRLNEEYKTAVQLLARTQAAALFLYGDRHIGFEQSLLKACRITGVPSMIIPVAFSSPEGALFIRRHRPEFYSSGRAATLINRLAKRMNPGWVHEDATGKILFYRGGQALAGYLHKSISLNPWYLGGGLSDKIAVENLEIKREYIAGGIPEEKIVVTGNPNLDDLYQSLIQRDQIRGGLTEKYGLQPGKPVLIFAVPQMFEDGILPLNEHLGILVELAKCMSAKEINLILSLHPKSERSNYKSLENREDIAIADERLKEILPAADIFIATFSSTVVWAALCGIPAIILDLYGANYSFFDYLKGSRRVKSVQAFDKELTHLLGDIEYYQEMSLKQKHSAPSSAVFDGGSRRRILSLAEDLIQNYCKAD